MNWWGSEKPFKEKVREMKQERLGNVSPKHKEQRLTYNNLTDEEKKFFDKYGINVASIRYFLWELQWEKDVDGILPEICFDGSETRIISEIKKLEPWNWVFKNPIELTEAIALYIQSKMWYDVISFLKQTVSLEGWIRWKNPRRRLRSWYKEKIIEQLALVWITMENKDKEEMTKIKTHGEFWEFIKRVVLDNMLLRPDSYSMSWWHVSQFKAAINTIESKKWNDIRKRMEPHMWTIFLIWNQYFIKTIPNLFMDFWSNLTKVTVKSFELS